LLFAFLEENGQIKITVHESKCSAKFDISEKLYNCPSCGGLLDVVYEFAEVTPDT